jgi:hypothetical protein
MYRDWEAKKETFEYHLAGDDLKAYYKALTSLPKYSAPYITEELPEHYCHVTYFEDGAIFLFTYNLYSDEQKQILKRFAAAFSLTYRRFKDLKKAEAQAREAQIEAALERVRSRTMAMFRSDELAETSSLLFKQLTGLGIEPSRLFIGIIKNDQGDIDAWATMEDGKL